MCSVVSERLMSREYRSVLSRGLTSDEYKYMSVITRGLTGDE